MSKITCPKCGHHMIKNGTTPAGKIRYICYGAGGRAQRTHCYTTTNPTSEAKGPSGKAIKDELPTNPKFKRKLEGKKYVITCAQNATPINKEFLASLENYCYHNDAELIVIPVRYKNPTSTWTESQANEEWWDPAVVPYLYNQRKKLCANLVLLGDIKIQPTAASPLTGLESLSHGESCIVGHPKFQMKSIPTPSHALPKIMHTSGAITVKNYSDTKAGAKGAFHHVFGALVVEVQGKKFHLRQLNADSDGTFIDWDTLYSPNTYEIAPPAAALVMGDSHYRFMDPKVKTSTFGPGGIIDQLKPETLVWHDLLDGYSRNHHHRGNVFIELSKRKADLHLVGKEVMETLEFLTDQTIKHGCNSVVVSSNHDDFLRQWIVNEDWRLDADNAEFYLLTALAMVRSVNTGPGGAECVSPFAYWLNTHKAFMEDEDDLRCLRTDESYTIKGVELGMHGHRGPNGARGSIKSFSNIGVKSVIGHSHTPGIENGAYQTGTSTALRLEYTEGPSSWIHSHVVIYANGKRSHINIIDGDFKYD